MVFMTVISIAGALVTSGEQRVQPTAVPRAPKPSQAVVIRFSMSVSADGYVNGPDGTFDWSTPSEELHRFHNQRVAETDAQLLGRRLYETMLVWETQEFSDPTMAEFAELWRPL